MKPTHFALFLFAVAVMSFTFACNQDRRPVTMDGKEVVETSRREFTKPSYQYDPRTCMCFISSEMKGGQVPCTKAVFAVMGLDLEPVALNDCHEHVTLGQAKTVEPSLAR